MATKQSRRDLLKGWIASRSLFIGPRDFAPARWLAMTLLDLQK
jgi:hypothetical protein